jgi:hypothetical protein
MGDLTVMKMRPGVRNSADNNREGAQSVVDNKIWRYLRCVLSLALLLGCLGMGAKAQDVSSIIGTVTDKTG